MPMTGTAEAFAIIPAGGFTMGAADGPHPEDGEGPPRPITLPAFRIARAAITVADFAAFVAATGHVTGAERAGGSLVFAGEVPDPERHAPVSGAMPWWRWVPGACWRAPTGAGPASPDLPVVHVCHADALAFCAWAGARLPTEAEWECAAGPAGNATLNIWRGRFPDAPAGPCGPVAAGSGRPNANGLYHARGNVWEWVADRFCRLHGPRPQHDPKGPLNGRHFVVKGGSFLCCPSYCARFRPSSRRPEPPEATASNLGFRMAADRPRGDRYGVSTRC